MLLLNNIDLWMHFVYRVPYLPSEDVDENEDSESGGTTTSSSSSFDEYDGSSTAGGHYYETSSSSGYSYSSASSSSSMWSSTSPAPPSIADFNSQDTPLEFADILPTNRRSYDKMEPPKKDGSFNCLFRTVPYSTMVAPPPPPIHFVYIGWCNNNNNNNNNVQYDLWLHLALTSSFGSQQPSSSALLFWGGRGMKCTNLIVI